MNDEEGAVPSLLGPQLTQNINDVMKNVSLISEQMTAITENADELVANTVPEVDALMVQLNSILLSVQDVLAGVKNNPLIRSGVPDRTQGKASTSQLRSEDF